MTLKALFLSVFLSFLNVTGLSVFTGLLGKFCFSFLQVSTVVPSGLIF